MPERFITSPADLLTPEELAHRLSIGRTKVYDLLNRGEIRSILIDRCRRIPSSEIPVFIARKLKEAQDA